MSGRGPYWLDPADRSYAFPPTRYALREPNGLLAVGGDLAPGRLMAAYRQGIFPWYSDDQPILWWSPDPRAVLFPADLKVSRSLAKRLRRQDYRVTLDLAFEAVLRGCAAPRRDGAGTWLTDPMQAAYMDLHRLGHAHSVEAWEGDELVGGLYGIALGGVFFGESMFSRKTDASKVALVCLIRQLERWGFGLVDCQVASSHLTSLGATELARKSFEELLNKYCDQPSRGGPWSLDRDLLVPPS